MMLKIQPPRLVENPHRSSKWVSLSLGLYFVLCGLGARALPPPDIALPPKPVRPDFANMPLTITAGKFEPTLDSFQQYQAPDWFRDAKFGIWSVWGPESVPEQGDWYARKMYMQGDPDYNYQVQTYGHPSVFGYKDIIALWNPVEWNPDQLMALYKQIGAKYFVVLANHHDNYDMWNSKYQPRWNSVAVGPHKDIVGLWRAAALKAGLRFGVTEHNARSYSWFQTSHRADTSGPLTGVPYDGNDPAFDDLYHPKFSSETVVYPVDPPAAWTHEWFLRDQDLLDSYHPDLFAFDGGIPFGDVGRKLVAHYYNANMQWHQGTLQAVMCVKDMPGEGEFRPGTCVQDIERGSAKGILPLPWQTETCIGDWYYKKNITYKTPSLVVHMLCDIVSKNGNLLLNAPLSPDGELDDSAVQTLTSVGKWLEVNGEAIYGTRPWRIYGEGPAMTCGGGFSEGNDNYGAQDFRFTTKGPVLYAIGMAWPQNGACVVTSLGSKATPGFSVSNVELVGSSGLLDWHQTDAGLEVTLPAFEPGDYAYVLKITGRNH
jgi:alpha-L-fucosidase